MVDGARGLSEPQNLLAQNITRWIRRRKLQRAWLELIEDLIDWNKLYRQLKAKRAMSSGLLRLKQLDGLRYPLSAGVIAINMQLYNAGANTPVAVFLVLSGVTSFLAYGARANDWDDASRAQFFQRRLVRLLPMLLVSTSIQLCANALWLFRNGVQIQVVCDAGVCTDTLTGKQVPSSLLSSSGGIFSFVVTLWSLILVCAGAGLICRGKACGCCQITRWPRPHCALLPLVVGTYLTGPGWYVGLLLFVQAYFLPTLLAEYGEAWRASPPSWVILLGWASAEAFQYGLPLLVFVATQSADAWYYATLYIYLGLPPLFRLLTFVFGMQIGRWALFAARANEGNNSENRVVTEAKTLIPVAVTALVVVYLHGFLEPESEMHRPDTGSTPLQWSLIHLIHPFNVLALICGLIAAPQSLIARILASPPLIALAELSYAVYVLQEAVIVAYVFVFNKMWYSEWELLQASEDASSLTKQDYFAVVLLTTLLAVPVTRWIEPPVAAWLRARVLPEPEPPYGELA